MASKQHGGHAANAGRPPFFSCTRHGKLTYSRRGDARSAARKLHDPGIREYPCSNHPGCWHIGHMPPPVKRGEMTAAQWFNLPRRERGRLWALETAAGPDAAAPDPS